MTGRPSLLVFLTSPSQVRMVSTFGVARAIVGAIVLVEASNGIDFLSDFREFVEWMPKHSTSSTIHNLDLFNHMCH